MAIRATDRPPDTLVGRRVARIGWALYGRAGFASAALSPEQQPWISLGDEFSALQAVQFVRRTVTAQCIVYKLDTVLGLAEAVHAGIGIGHLPCFIGDQRPGLKDRDARWTVKLSKSKPSGDGSPRIDIAVPAFGYKNHVAIDRRHGLIRTWTATHAAPSRRSAVVEPPLEGEHGERGVGGYSLPVEGEREAPRRKRPAFPHPS